MILPGLQRAEEKLAAAVGTRRVTVKLKQSVHFAEELGLSKHVLYATGVDSILKRKRHAFSVEVADAVRSHMQNL